MDLTSLVSSLNLAQTMAARQDLQQYAAQVAARGMPLEEAHQQDVLDLKGHLEVLVGGQEALSEQLSAASQELKAEWAAAANLLDQMALDVVDIKQRMEGVQQDVQQLLAYMRGTPQQHPGCRQQQQQQWPHRAQSHRP